MVYMTEKEILEEIAYLEGWKAEITAMYQRYEDKHCPASARQLEMRDLMVKDLTYRIMRMNILLDAVRKEK